MRREIMDMCGCVDVYYVAWHREIIIQIRADDVSD